MDTDFIHRRAAVIFAIGGDRDYDTCGERDFVNALIEKAKRYNIGKDYPIAADGVLYHYSYINGLVGADESCLTTAQHRALNA